MRSARDDNQPIAPLPPLSPKAVNTRSDQSSSLPDPMAIEDADYLGTLLDMFDSGEPGFREVTSESAPEISYSHSNNPGQAFLSWVREGIQSHKLIINDSKAKIHTRSEEHTSELQSLMRISYAVFCLTTKKH